MTTLKVPQRHQILNELLGKPWVANAKGPDAYDCYHLCVHVQRVVFGRTMPEIEIPTNPSWSYVMNQIEGHPERKKWQRISSFVPGLPVQFQDGALVAMACNRQLAHLGVWFQEESCVLHTDNPDGVVFQNLSTLHAMGWRRLEFFEPF